MADFWIRYLSIEPGHALASYTVGFVQRRGRL